MKKFKLVFFITLLITILIGCSQASNSLIEVNINGEVKQLKDDVFSLISKKDQPTVKLAINPQEKGDIEIVKENITYKLFEKGNGAVVYFNDGEITQYEISKDELNKIKEAIK